MSRRKIDPTEMKESELAPFTLAALAMLGGTASREDILNQAERLLKDKFAPADLRLVYRPKDGPQDFAPEGYEGDTWAVWRGKAHQHIGRNLTAEGLVRLVSTNVYTLTEKGMQQVGSFAASWLCVE